MTTTETVSNDLLATFDRLVGAGENAPLAELKKRFADAEYFRYRDHQLYKTLIELPVTVAMITGDTSTAVRKILDGLRELHGDDLLFSFEGRGDQVTLQVRIWRDETALRALWREYAEDEYKSTVLAGGGAA
ncbi:hypothetical protein MOQ72_28985 [Saccharopolyspora sp. K220]|uniref:hypothetical protein n=1 Tax=Saccharopolyspora soli TaxID=2926618 RepID=UPI001F596625|nr:hypothetical protein [Saccharopolyspora soli]MCI2421476.1 hypothetical protein [Saccharopolyspora soli]